MSTCGDLSGNSSGGFGDSAVTSMSDAQARRTLLGAFDRASKADRSYLVRVAMMLGGSVGVASTSGEVRVVASRPQPTHLRLVRPA